MSRDRAGLFGAFGPDPAAQRVGLLRGHSLLRWGQAEPRAPRDNRQGE